MPMSYDQVRGWMWTKSCLGRIRKVCYTPRSCDHALFQAKRCKDSVISMTSASLLIIDDSPHREPTSISITFIRCGVSWFSAWALEAVRVRAAKTRIHRSMISVLRKDVPNVL